VLKEPKGVTTLVTTLLTFKHIHTNKYKYYPEIEIKKFGKSKGWLSKKLSSSENYTDKVISVLEERSIWQRYGL